MSEQNKMSKLDKILIGSGIGACTGVLAGGASLSAYFETQKDIYSYGAFLAPVSVLVFGVVRWYDIYQKLKKKSNI